MVINNECEWTLEERKNAIAWRDGLVVHALKEPYRRDIDEMTFLIDNVPPGISVLDLHRERINMSSNGRLIIEL